jgi:tetratricopeptide (TPR) repeat protein
MQAQMSTLTQLLHYCLLDSTRRPIAGALADAAALAGWQALDVGALSRAWEHHETAATAGRIADEPASLAHARGQQAYALLEIGRSDDALTLVRDAREQAGRRIPNRLISWLWCAEAEVAAAAGLESESRQALDQADAVLPPGSGDDPELPYVSLDQHHLVRWRGSTLARLGDHEAVADLSRALSTIGPEYVRAQTGLHVDLAQALISADAQDAAEQHIVTARSLASQIGSVRQLRRLAKLAAAA